VPTVRFVNELVTVDVPSGTALRDVALEQGVELYRGMWTHVNCRGNGICGRCRVWVVTPKKDGAVRSLRERFHRLQGTVRLACQLLVVEDMEIRTRPIGPTAREQPQRGVPRASYKEAAEQRYLEAKEAEAKEAVQAKAKEAAAKEAAAKASPSTPLAETADTKPAAPPTSSPPPSE
jgi:ferredoxin